MLGCLLITLCIPDAYEFTQSHGNLIPSGQLTLDDLSEVRGALYEASAKWYDIGIELKFSIGTLDTIRKDFPHAAEDCLRALCIRWLKCTEPRPTWAALTKALESPPVGEGHLAQQLRDKYCREGEDVISRVYSTPVPSPPGAPLTSQGNTSGYSNTVTH